MDAEFEDIFSDEDFEYLKKYSGESSEDGNPGASEESSEDGNRGESSVEDSEGGALVEGEDSNSETQGTGAVEEGISGALDASTEVKEGLSPDISVHPYIAEWLKANRGTNKEEVAIDYDPFDGEDHEPPSAAESKPGMRYPNIIFDNVENLKGHQVETIKEMLNSGTDKTIAVYFNIDGDMGEAGLISQRQVIPLIELVGRETIRGYYTENIELSNDLIYALGT